ncbi:MAG: hypothetical protein FJ317_03720, partial [SAR202 cluster bacterium]|nr:hypothetical protein [SAR202 cluster bacterium]
MNTELTVNLTDLQRLSEDELRSLAQEMNVAENGAVLKKHEILSKVLQAYAERNGSIQVKG